MSFLIKTTAPPDAQTCDARPQLPMIALVIVGCKKEPWRLGHLAYFPPDKVRWFGRGGLPIEDYSSYDRHRPGDPFPPQLGISACLQGDSLSRCQASMMGRGVDLVIENLEACPMYVNGVETKRAVVRPNDTVRFGNEVLFVCVLRLPEFPPLRHASIAHAFGGPDAFGIVGEGPLAWQLRDDATYVGRRSDDVLILGETGSGKTAIATLIHKVSSRARGPFFEKNCSTLNEGLAPAELFGKIANFPNPGPAVPGILPASEGGSVFLDEIGRLSVLAQGQLLTVLSQKSYQVTGESKVRLVDVRVIGAMNRARADLEPDFQFRLKATLRVAPLREQREEIGLLVQHLLRERLKKDESLMRIFSTGPSRELHPRISLRLMDFLVRHELTGNARELDILLAAALMNSHEDWVEMFPAGSPELVASTSASAPRSAAPSVPPASGAPGSSGPSSAPASAPRSAPPSTERDVPSGKEVEVTEATIADAYEKARGNHSKAAKLLGMERNRLYRIMKGLGMKVPEE
jgi:sigma-54 specific flagellar transcriptional regulator A